MAKKRKFPISITFIILMLLLAGVATINIYLDKVVLKHIVPAVEKFLDKKISVDGVSLGIYGVKIDGLNIRDKNNETIFICSKIYVYFQIKPLLKKEFIIDQIRLVNLQTTIYHKPDGQWVSSIFKKKGEKRQEGKIKIELKKIFLEKGRIKIIDDWVSPSVTTVLKKAEGYFDLEKKIKYEIKGDVESTKGGIHILGSVDPESGVYKVHFKGLNLDAVKYRPYYRIYFNYPVKKGKITKISLVLSGDNKTYRNKGEIDLKDLAFKYWPDQKHVQAKKARVVFNSGPNIVLLDEISGVFDEGLFSVEGKVWPAVEGRDRYELNLHLEDLDMAMAKERYIRQPGLKRDFNIKGKGILDFVISVNGDSFKYEGKANLSKSEIDFGKVLFKPENRVCNLVFNVTYKKDENVRGNFKFISQPVIVKGEGELIDVAKKEPRLDLNLTLLSGKVEELLVLLPPWPKEIKLFGGTDKLEVRIFNNQSGQTVYRSEINGTPLEWEYGELLNKPPGMESEIIFSLIPDEGKLLLVDSKLTFGSSEVNMDEAVISPLGDEGLRLDLDFKKLFYDDARLISDFFKEEDITLEGSCSSKFVLTSSGRGVNIKGMADLFGTQLGYGDFIRKNREISSNTKFNISWTGKDIFFIKELELESGKNKFYLQGEIRDYDQDQPQYDLKIFSDSFYWGGITPGYMPGFNNYRITGNSSVRLDLTGQKKFLNIKGNMDLTQCKTNWKDILKKEEGVDHRINFDFVLGQNNFIIKAIEIFLGDFSLTGVGRIENINIEDSKLVLVWKTKDFKGKKMKSFIHLGWLENFELKGELGGEVSFYKEDNLQKVKGEIDMEKAEVYYRDRSHKPSGIASNFVYTVRIGDKYFFLDPSKYIIDRSVFNVEGKVEKVGDSWVTNLRFDSDRLYLKEIIPYFSPKMASELKGLTLGGPSKIGLDFDNAGKRLNWQGEIDLQDNYLSYKDILAKPEGLESRLIFKIATHSDNISFDTMSFVWNDSRMDFSGKIENIKTVPTLDLLLTSDMLYPEIKMIIADSSKGRDIIKKFYNMRKDEEERINLNLKITGKIENPEIKSDWGLITTLAIKIGLQNSMEFLEQTTGKTLETTLNFGLKTVETTVLVGGKVLRETVRAGASVIEGVFKIIWPFE